MAWETAALQRATQRVTAWFLDYVRHGVRDKLGDNHYRAVVVDDFVFDFALHFALDFVQLDVVRV
jgi:hypothetical protein